VDRRRRLCRAAWPAVGPAGFHSLRRLFDRPRAALLVSTLQFQGWPPVIGVAIVFGVGQILESFVLTPWLVGERIGLHPLAVIFALMAFGQLFGFVGILIASAGFRGLAGRLAGSAPTLSRQRPVPGRRAENHRMMRQLLLDIRPIASPSLNNYVVGANRELLNHLRKPWRTASRASLYLWGESGSGCTHLLRALAAESRVRGLYLEADQVNNTPSTR
jgi:hypothetical protein